jgi:hypothetical protein
MSVKAHGSSEQALWLISCRLDSCLACGGASIGLLAALLAIFWRGDRELDALDFVLSELHLGATYQAIVRRRLWRRLPVDVLLVPLVILAITYALSMSGQTVLLTSIAMYAAIWHRGRQNLGVARFYQRQLGGPASQAHKWLFCGAVYLPMVAGLVAYTHLAPLQYEGEPYLALNLGAEITSIVGFAAAGWVIAYFVCTLWLKRAEQPAKWVTKKAWEWFEKRGTNGKYPIASSSAAFIGRLATSERRVVQTPAAASQAHGPLIHPGERWVVLAHAVAFASGYILGAANASFLLVLAVHHEVQYLYFTYAMSRRSAQFREASHGEMGASISDCYSTGVRETENAFRSELKHVAFFFVWPAIGFGGAVAGGWLALEWLAPLGVGGLFCHYWLDGRIWTRRSFQT